jgi:hypothetical protein
MFHLPISFRDAAFGGVLGAALGAALVASVTGALGARELLAANPDVLPWLATIMSVIVAQFAVAGGLCALILRPFAQPSLSRAQLSGTKRLMAR